MGNNISTAEEGVIKLEKNNLLIKKYFDLSTVVKGFLGYNCCKVEIPGNELNQNSSFFLFNIEGFFDIEKGIFFNIKNLVNLMIFFNNNKIDISSYEDFSVKIQIFLIFAEIAICFKDEWANDISEVGEKKCLKKINKKNIKEYKKKKQIEKKIKEKEDISKNETKINEIKKVNKLNQFIKFIFNTNPKRIAFGLAGIRNCQIAINFLEKIIPFEQFKGYITSTLKFIEGGVEIFAGIKEGIKCYKNFNFFSFLEAVYFLVQGAKNISESSIEIYNKYQENNLTKAQENFRTLLNKMQQLFSDLVQTNFQKLYEGNVIVLAIDNSKSMNKNNNEGVYLKIIKVEGVDHYAKCLNNNDTNRNNYIKNMTLLYSNLIYQINEFDNFKSGSQINEMYAFLLIVEKLILKQNDINFEEEIDSKYIENVIIKYKNIILDNLDYLIEKLEEKAFDTSDIENILENKRNSHEILKPITPIKEVKEINDKITNKGEKNEKRNKIYYSASSTQLSKNNKRYFEKPKSNYNNDSLEAPIIKEVNQKKINNTISNIYAKKGNYNGVRAFYKRRNEKNNIQLNNSQSSQNYLDKQAAPNASNFNS